MVSFMRWLYLQYLLNTAMYVMEPFEVYMFNSFIVIVAVIWAYAAYVFLPDQLLQLKSLFESNITST